MSQKQERKKKSVTVVVYLSVCEQVKAMSSLVWVFILFCNTNFLKQETLVIYQSETTTKQLTLFNCQLLSLPFKWFRFRELWKWQGGRGSGTELFFFLLFFRIEVTFVMHSEGVTIQCCLHYVIGELAVVYTCRQCVT